MFIARPFGVFISLVLNKFSVKEKLMVSWVGLKGAVPIILATFPLLAGVPGSEIIFNIVFFVVLISTLVQGTTISWIVKKFKLA
jgi:cell volume regulation protein A